MFELLLYLMLLYEINWLYPFDDDDNNNNNNNITILMLDGQQKERIAQNGSIINKNRIFIWPSWLIIIKSKWKRKKLFNKFLLLVYHLNNGGMSFYYLFINIKYYYHKLITRIIIFRRKVFVLIHNWLIDCVCRRHCLCIHFWNYFLNKNGRILANCYTQL
jgi:hypothetical protein